MRNMLALALMGACGLAAAAPERILQDYVQAAAQQQPGFAASAARGEAFFRQRFAVSPEMPACSACHTDNPAAGGRHAVTGKPIRPLAPAVNPERFADPARVEKWFGRNCREVVGRACTAAEKADFIQFVMGVR